MPGERPRTYKAEGVILRRRNIGEADSIFTIFADGGTKFDAVARGVRKARSHMRGHLEPLARTRFLVARGRSLDVFTQAEMVTAYRAIREDLERSAAALYCAELVDRFTIERAENPGLFDLFVMMLDAIEAGAPLHIVRYFELQLLALTGFDVHMDACAGCTGRLPEQETLLSPSAGGFVCPDCRGGSQGGRILGVRAVKVLRFARHAGLADFAALRLDDALGAELASALGEFVRYHADREPVTGRYIDQVARLPAARAEA